MVSFILSAALTYLVYVSSTAFGHANPRELVVHRHVDAKICSVIQARETQHHRRLGVSLESHVTETAMVSTHDGKGTMERIRLYAYSDRVLWDQLSSICEGHKLDFSSFSQHIPLSIALHGDDSQLALQAPTEDAIKVPSALPLDVQRIAGSGPSANRVDLTFFSDGCE